MVYGDVIFYLGQTKSFVKLKKITRNQDYLESSESYDLEQSLRSLKDSDCFGQGRS